MAVLWFASLAVPAPISFVMRGIAAAFDIAAPLVAGRRPGLAPCTSSILVLGEVIHGIVNDTKWAAPSVVIGAEAREPLMFVIGVADARGHAPTSPAPRALTHSAGLEWGRGRLT